MRSIPRTTIEAALIVSGDEVHGQYGWHDYVRDVTKVSRGILIRFCGGRESVYPAAEPVKITERKHYTTATQPVGPRVITGW